MNNLPAGVTDSDCSGAPQCERCLELEDCLSDALEFLVEYEEETRQLDSGNIIERQWRRSLKQTIAEAKRLG